MITRQQAFDVYFASLAGWRLHPGYLRDGAEPPCLEEISSIALDMLRLRDMIFDQLFEEEVC